MQLKARLLVGLAVIVVCVACAAAPLVFLRALEVAERLQRGAKVLQATGPRATLTGRLRGALATLWWLGPLRPHPAPDPVEECGVRLSGPQSWWEALWKLQENRRRLACVEEHVRLIQEANRQFGRRLATLLVMAKVMALLTLCTVAAMVLYAIMPRGGAPPGEAGFGGAAMAPVVPPGEGARDGAESVADAAGASVGEGQESTGAGEPMACSWPTIHVPLGPQVSFTVRLEDSAAPAWFTPDDHQLLRGLMVQEAQAWREHLLSGKIEPVDMQALLQYVAETFLEERTYVIRLYVELKAPGG